MASVCSYVSELRRYIDVDIYGGCGRLRCPLSAGELCLDMLERRYYFYLAFENSLCVDYVTEKFWRTLQRDVVAVVLGAANYSQLVPPGSHIDVRDFRSPRHLADRLRALMTRDVDSYAEMLRRKRRLSCSFDDDDDDDDHSVLFQTRLCRYLDATDGKTRTTDLEISWNARVMCTSPRTFYRGVADAIAY